MDIQEVIQQLEGIASDLDKGLMNVHDAVYVLPGTLRELAQALKLHVNKQQAKQYTCECGQVYWYVPGRAFSCVNCFEVIYEDTDGVIHKVFGDG